MRYCAWTNDRLTTGSVSAEEKWAPRGKSVRVMGWHDASRMNSNNKTRHGAATRNQCLSDASSGDATRHQQKFWPSTCILNNIFNVANKSWSIGKANCNIRHIHVTNVVWRKRIRYSKRPKNLADDKSMSASEVIRRRQAATDEILLRKTSIKIPATPPITFHYKNKMADKRSNLRSCFMKVREEPYEKT